MCDVVGLEFGLDGSGVFSCGGQHGTQRLHYNSCSARAQATELESDADDDQDLNDIELAALSFLRIHLFVLQ